MSSSYIRRAASLGLLLIALGAPDASAVRYTSRPLLWQRTAVSGYFGGGLPVGEFSSSRGGDGNHESWPFDWAVEVEHFAGRTWSLGFSIAGTTYTDKTDASLETNLATYTGFVRVVVPTATPVRPYLRAGMGGVKLQFQDPDDRNKADTAFSFQAGGGLLWLPERWLGLNAQILYYQGGTYDSYVSGFSEPTIVGFDVKYWSFSGGVSLFFP
jgi:opacity protein-like surface antigen